MKYYLWRCEKRMRLFLIIYSGFFTIYFVQYLKTSLADIRYLLLWCATYLQNFFWIYSLKKFLEDRNTGPVHGKPHSNGVEYRFVGYKNQIDRTLVIGCCEPLIPSVLCQWEHEEFTRISGLIHTKVRKWLMGYVALQILV